MSDLRACEQNSKPRTNEYWSWLTHQRPLPRSWRPPSYPAPASASTARPGAWHPRSPVAPPHALVLSCRGGRKSSCERSRDFQFLLGDVRLTAESTQH